MNSTDVLSRVDVLPDDLKSQIFHYIPDRIPFKNELIEKMKNERWLFMGNCEENGVRAVLFKQDKCGLRAVIREFGEYTEVEIPDKFCLLMTEKYTFGRKMLSMIH